MTAAPVAYPDVDHRAPCRHGDPERFHPTKGTSAEAIEAVKAECDTCPFRDPCLAWALQREPWGIWAGTTPPERADMRKRLGIRKQPAPHVSAKHWNAAHPTLRDEVPA